MNSSSREIRFATGQMVPGFDQNKTKLTEGAFLNLEASQCSETSPRLWNAMLFSFYKI